MSLYSYNFDLLPIPQKTALSWGNESTRAILPDFQSTDQLKEFISRLFVLQFNIPNVYLQVKICAGLLIAIILNDILILARRRYEKSLWIARLVHKPSGTILVPNAALAFLAIEGGFVILLIAFIFMIIETFETKKIQPHNWILWFLLIWFPAFLGVFMSMVGCHFATPSTRPYGDQRQERDQIHGDSISRKRSRLKDLMENAVFINFTILFIPVLVLLSVFIPTIIANIQYNKAQEWQDQWQIKYADQQYFTQEMVVEAQAIWYLVLKGIFLASIVFCIWFFWALFVLISFTFCSFRLLYTIYNEYRKIGIDGPTFIVTHTDNPSSSMIKHIISNALREQNNYNLPKHETNSEVVITASTNVENIPLAQLEHLGQFDTTRTNCWNSDVSLDGKGIEQIPTPLKEKRLTFFKRETNPTLTRTDQHKSFSERMKETLPKLIITPQRENEEVQEELMMNLSQTDQKKKMIKAGWMMCIHLCLHSPACAIFSAIALFMALTVHSSFEQPSFDQETNSYGNQFEHFGSIGLLFVVYSTLIIGMGGSVALLKRVYEPVFSSISFTNRFNKSTSSKPNISHQTTLADLEEQTNGTKVVVDKEEGKGKKVLVFRPTGSTFFETQSGAHM